MIDKPRRYKRMTIGGGGPDSKYRIKGIKGWIYDLIDHIASTRMQGCLKRDCLENEQLRCSLKYMSIGNYGECTWYTKIKGTKEITEAFVKPK